MTRANVPGAALMAVCPAVAAVLAARRAGELRGLARLAARRPRPGWSWLVAVFGMPTVIAVTAVLTGQGTGFTFPGWDVPVLALAYTVAAAGEGIVTYSQLPSIMSAAAPKSPFKPAS